MLTEVQYNTYMNDNLEVNPVSWAHHDAEDDSTHYENGILYSVCVKGVFFSEFFSLNTILKNPKFDYKAWAIEILTEKIENHFNEVGDRTDFFTVEELEDKDFSKGSFELMEEERKKYIKKLSSDDIHALTWK
ncbi:hypothetical protein EHW90_00285 [Lachnoanaerobaculum orale]|uniref:Uncharacterized protein n=1 Tax=Lachnoanaerobaculum orale TaxID=979627 RepID=A0A3P3Q2R1_9FIRM|nr:hypothetical protein [Lachnoanaerobaculum orale]RRJ15522.1 hypothetical protein EHW90_00285 [Lachnoanaerobaculum orale]